MTTQSRSDGVRRRLAISLGTLLVVAMTVLAASLARGQTAPPTR